jgi:biopolymer transport protein ExbB
MNDATGIAHFLTHTDAIGKGLFIILLLMSVTSWYYIITKLIARYQLQKRSQIFVRAFWNAASLEVVQRVIITRGADNPFARLTHHALIHRASYVAHHAQASAARLEETGSMADFLTRAMRRVIDEETTRLENGLTVLASVGATAPFVGLFGTVWGVYHALVTIGSSGSASLEQIAGPVGESLIMTGLGLAVAIPAVLGYNALVRGNRVLLGRLDAFAYDIFAFLTTGQQAIIVSPAKDDSANNHTKDKRTSGNNTSVLHNGEAER